MIVIITPTYTLTPKLLHLNSLDLWTRKTTMKYFQKRNFSQFVAENHKSRNRQTPMNMICSIEKLYLEIGKQRKCWQRYPPKLFLPFPSTKDHFFRTPFSTEIRKSSKVSRLNMASYNRKGRVWNTQLYHNFSFLWFPSNQNLIIFY